MILSKQGSGKKGHKPTDNAFRETKKVQNGRVAKQTSYSNRMKKLEKT